MAARCLLYYVTDRAAFPGDESARRQRLLEKISEAASAGVDYIQLREKNLCARDLELLAREALQVIRESGKLKTETREPRTALLINSRTDVALAIGADGVHLPASDLSPLEVRAVWSRASRQAPILSVSCHSPEEAIQAGRDDATLVLFAPMFEKKDVPGINAKGLDALHAACRATIPVLALGGITLHNAESCLRAGAAGFAAIRLFQENKIEEVVRTLCGPL
jgi:thiamine-phosphate pyrophosphorylase